MILLEIKRKRRLSFFYKKYFSELLRVMEAQGLLQLSEKKERAMQMNIIYQKKLAQNLTKEI